MAGSVYAVDPPEALRRIELDGLTAIFHAPSGTTHIVAPPVPQILDALSEGPADAEAILARIGMQFEVSDAMPVEAIAARLAELEAIGLVLRP